MGIPTYFQILSKQRASGTLRENREKVAKASGRDSQLALLEYRNTPLDGTSNYAPTQMVNSRLLKSRLPNSSNFVETLCGTTRKLLKARQDKQNVITTGKLEAKVYPEQVTAWQLGPDHQKGFGSIALQRDTIHSQELY